MLVVFFFSLWPSTGPWELELGTIKLQCYSNNKCFNLNQLCLYELLYVYMFSPPDILHKQSPSVQEAAEEMTWETESTPTMICPR